MNQNSSPIIHQPNCILLTPLAEQSTRNLVWLLFCVTFGIRLRPELQLPGLSDPEVVRRALREREWSRKR
jgi:hypothetical protein